MARIWSIILRTFCKVLTHVPLDVFKWQATNLLSEMPEKENLVLAKFCSTAVALDRMSNCWSEL